MEIAGKLMRVKAAQVRLCASRAVYTRVYPRGSQEMVFDAHARAFVFFGGVPTRGIYDNMMTAVDAVFTGKTRVFNRRLLIMTDHSMIEPTACNPAAGWEKGQVEHQVQTIRRRFFQPRLPAARRQSATLTIRQEAVSRCGAPDMPLSPCPMSPRDLARVFIRLWTSMRRIRNILFKLSLCLSVAGTLGVASAAHAQYGGGRGGRGGGGGDDEQQADDAKKKKRDQDFGKSVAPLPQLKNAGPCPYVKTLYDAARYVEFKDGVEAAANVGYTGEIQTIASICEYKSNDPIKVRTRILFELGRGPQAAGRGKTYAYWVAVTDRNNAVLSKEWFTLPVNFANGQDRVFATETLGAIVIPRRDAKVSGANFEVLIGFDVTPQMAAFNRDGKRFRPNAGSAPPDAARRP